MSVSIRLTRGGSKKKPSYRVVVLDSRKKRDSDYLERLGHYNPCVNPAEIVIDVEKYEPPNYVISFQNIEHYSSTTDFVKSRTSRYSYDLDFRRMYVEICVDDVCHWEYLDPNKIKAGSGFDKMTYRYISAGELAFYLAYNQSFYDEIQSAELKRFVEEGRSRVPLVNLPDGGDSQIGHIYNHRTGEMEWWKWDYAVKKFVRVK